MLDCKSTGAPLAPDELAVSVHLKCTSPLCANDGIDSARCAAHLHRSATPATRLRTEMLCLSYSHDAGVVFGLHLHHLLMVCSLNQNVTMMFLSSTFEVLVHSWFSVQKEGPHPPRFILRQNVLSPLMSTTTWSPRCTTESLSMLWCCLSPQAAAAKVQKVA